MSTNLKKTVSSMNVENDVFVNEKDKTNADVIFEKYSLQIVLETLSDFLKDDHVVPGYDKYITVTRTLVHNAPDTWLRDFVIGFNDTSTASVCLTSLKSLSKIAEVSPFKGEDREYIADDFKDVSYRGYLVLSCLDALFQRLSKFPDKKELFKCMVNVSYFCIVLLALHHDADIWTSRHTNTLSETLLGYLLDYWSLRSVSELLVLNLHHSESDEQPSKKTSILGKLLLQWKPYLLRQTWKQSPTIAASFSWCLKALKFPHTSEFLELILPPSLLFVDDYMTLNKEMGVQCLISIMETAGGEELRWYGRADVIYEALKLQMYRTEETLLRLNLKALILILKVVEKDQDELSAQTRYDEIFCMLLQNASHENKLSLRRVHTEYLHIFIECLGINAVKYLKNIIDVTDEYLEISDAPTELARINILKALISLIEAAWPRIQPYMTKIVKILVKLLHQITSDNTDLEAGVKEKMIILVENVFSLLKAIDKEMIDQSLSTLTQLPFPSECLEVMNKILQSKI